MLLHLQLSLELVFQCVAERHTEEVHYFLCIAFRGDVLFHEFCFDFFVHNLEVLYPEDDEGPEQYKNCTAPDEVVEIDFEVVEIHVDSDHNGAGHRENLKVHQSRLHRPKRTALLLALLLEPSLLVLSVVDSVEDLRELALVGLPAEHEEEHNDEDGDGWLEVLPARQFVELALDLEQKVVLLPH